MKTRALVFLFFMALSPFSFCKVIDIPHLRVIWHEDPAREAIVTWSGQKAFENQIFHLSTQQNGTTRTRTLSAKSKKIFGTKSWIHYVKLENLNPHSKYSFSISTPQGKGASYFFITAPPKGKDFMLAFGGDSRSDREKRREINQSLSHYLEKNPKVLALVHGGDFVSNGFSWKLWKEWLDDYQLTTTSNNRILPIIATRGNHEIASTLFNKIFFRPGNKVLSNYYVTRFGDLSLITLNTNISHAGRQKRWLKKTLEQESKSQKWLLANYHRPAFPAVKKPGRARKHWVPLFEKFKLDLVFESDGHALKKTVPIFKEKRNDQKGIIYIGEGGLGVPLRVAKRKDQWYFNPPGYAKSAYHFITLHVNETKLDVKVISPDGHKVLDEFSLHPKQRL
jgi:hypothetical protein